MSRTFDQAFISLLGNEGGEVDNRYDPGGHTKYGISASSYPDIDISGLSLADAKAIYERDFWVPLSCDQMPPSIAFEVFDAGVNHGKPEAARLLQASLGVTQDGHIGPITLAAIRTCDPERFKRYFNAGRLEFYTTLPAWPRFGKGWVNRVAANLRRQ